MVGCRGEQHLAVAQVVAEHAHLGLGPKGASEQPVGMQALQPLAIESIGFRAAGGARSGGTATQCSASPMSIPAACGLRPVGGPCTLAAAGEEALRDEGEEKRLCGVSWQPPEGKPR